jgi:hypothetical protein
MVTNWKSMLWLAAAIAVGIILAQSTQPYINKALGRA